LIIFEEKSISVYNIKIKGLKEVILAEEKISLPADVAHEVDFKKDDKLNIKVEAERDRIIIERDLDSDEGQTFGLRYFLIPSLVASIIFFIYEKYKDVKTIDFTGNSFNSLSTQTILLGLLTGIISFSIFFIKGKRGNKRYLKVIYWRNFPTIVISFALMLGSVLISIFWLFGILFAGADFDIYTSTFLIFIFTSIINYVMIYFAVTITPNRIITLLMLVIIGGVMSSMISNSNLKWWKINFSFLGTSNAQSSWQFNITLIISALLMLALIDYLFVILNYSYPKNKRLLGLRILLTIMALSLGGVGIFPNNKVGHLHELHDQSAWMLVYVVIIMIIGIKWFLPTIPKEFYYFSYGVGIFLIIADYLFQGIGYLSLTAFELIATFMVFAWILLLFQNLEKLSRVGTKDYKVILE
jgi:Predicted membrane protein